MSLVSWNFLLEHLRPNLENEEFQVWIEPLQLLPSRNKQLILGCPNAFHRAWVRDRFLPKLRNILKKIDPQASIILELIPPNNISSFLNSRSPQQLHLPRLTSNVQGLNQKFIFERFIAGESNEFAWAAAKAIAQGQHFFSNTLFLISATGLGKSHLSQAVANHIINLYPQLRVTYLTAENFANQMITALRGKRMNEFKENFRRGCDVFLLEEVQFLAGKDKTQEELGYTLDALIDAGSRIVITGNCHLHQIKGIKRHLLSRLTAGVTATIDPPDLATRIRILEAKVREEGIYISPTVLEYLAQKITGDVRALQSALVGLMAKGSLTSRPMNLGLATEILGQMQHQLSRFTPEQIKDTVAKTYGLLPGELGSKSRRKAITRPRNLALLICRRHTKTSYASLGRLFNRDHSTIMYSIEQIERSLNIDPNLKQELSFLEQKLGII